MSSSSWDHAPTPDAVTGGQSDMVERVARAIEGAYECQHCGTLVSDGVTHRECGCEKPSWREASPQNKARAAITAMRADR